MSPTYPMKAPAEPCFSATGITAALPTVHSVAFTVKIEIKRLVARTATFVILLFRIVILVILNSMAAKITHELNTTKY